MLRNLTIIQDPHLWGRTNFEPAQTTEPPGHKLLVVNVVVVGPFEEAVTIAQYRFNHWNKQHTLSPDPSPLLGSFSGPLGGPRTTRRATLSALVPDGQSPAQGGEGVEMFFLQYCLEFEVEYSRQYDKKNISTLLVFGVDVFRVDLTSLQLCLQIIQKSSQRSGPLCLWRFPETIKRNKTNNEFGPLIFLRNNLYCKGRILEKQFKKNCPRSLQKWKSGSSLIVKHLFVWKLSDISEFEYMWQLI